MVIEKATRQLLFRIMEPREGGGDLAVRPDRWPIYYDAADADADDAAAAAAAASYYSPMDAQKKNVSLFHFSTIRHAKRLQLSMYEKKKLGNDETR